MLSGSQEDIQRQDEEIKRYGLIALGIAVCGVTLTAGVQAAYLITAIAATVAGISYPDKIEDWFNAHRMMLIGAAIGIFVGGGIFSPITMVLGGFIGHLGEAPINAAVKVANKTVDAYNTVSNGVAQVTDLPNNAWVSLKSGVERAYGYFGTPAEKQVEATNVPTPVVVIASVKPVVEKEKEKAKPPIAKPQTAPKALKPTTEPLPRRAPSQRIANKKAQTAKNEVIIAVPEVAKPKLAAPIEPQPVASQSIWHTFASYFTRKDPAPSTDNILPVTQPLSWQQASQNQKCVDNETKTTISAKKPRTNTIMTIM